MEEEGPNAIVRDGNVHIAPIPAQDLCRGKTCWVLTDGKVGDAIPCLGLAQALGLAIEQRIVRPRAPFATLAPRGPIDWAERSSAPNSPIRPPFPDFLIASGRRAAPYLSAVRRLSPHSFTIFLKNPRRPSRFAHLVWAPVHDGLRGPNILTSVTAPHSLSLQTLALARKNPDVRVAVLPKPRVALLLGGDSRHHHFSQETIAEIDAMAATLAASGHSVMITPSRRTPRALLAQLARRQSQNPAMFFLWDGSGENPYTAMLALADAIIVTADSTNMVGEAVATDVPVMAYEPEGGHIRLKTFLDLLEGSGAIRRWRGDIEYWPRRPLDATPAIAAEAAQHYTLWLENSSLESGLIQRRCKRSKPC